MKIVFSLLVVGFAVAGCTRNGLSQGVSLSVASGSNRSFSSTSAAPQLMHLSVNVNGQVQQRDYDPASRPAPATEVLQFNLPSGTTSASIQAVGVYQGASAMEFHLFSQTITQADAPSGSYTINLYSSPVVGSATKMSYLFGRVSVPGVGFPTGQFRMVLQPYGMVVQNSGILDGWFNALALDGTGISFDYVVATSDADPGITVFKGLTSKKDATFDATTCSAQSLSGYCPFYEGAGWSHRLKMHRPTNYKRNNDSSALANYQVVQEQDIVFGYFGAIADSNHAICYANDVKESVPGYFMSSDLPAIGSAAQAPFGKQLDIDFTTAFTPSNVVSTPPANDTSIRLVGTGGVGVTSSTLYLNGATGLCSQTNVSLGNAFIINHTSFYSDGNESGGSKGVFQPYYPFSQNNRYGSATSAGIVSWNPLPALTVVTGTLTAAAKAGDLSISFSAKPQIGQSVIYNSTSLGNIVTSVSGTSAPYTVNLLFPLAAPMASGSSMTFVPFDGYAVFAKYYIFASASANAGSSYLTLSDPTLATKIAPNMPVSGQGIANGTFVQSVAAAGVVTLNQPVAASFSNNQISFNQSNYNGHSDCNTLPYLGYLYAGYTPYLPVTNTFSLVDSTTSKFQTGLVYPGMTTPVLPGSSNSVGFSYAICPFKQFINVAAASANLSFLGDYAQAQVNQGAANIYSRSPFGWAHSSTATATTLNANTVATLNGVLVNSPASTTTTLNVPSSSGFSAGNEIMIYVAGNFANACGNNVNTGNYDFARVLATTANTIIIPSGTFADNLPSTIVTGNCPVEVLNVPHYSDVLLPSGFTLSLGGSPFIYASPNSGVVAFKASGKLVLDNATLDVSGKGYQGGMSGFLNGGGTTSDRSSTFFPNNSGGYNYSTGNMGFGGASIGNGGQITGLAKQAMGNNQSSGGGIPQSLIMGGGGGGGYSSSGPGGSGGGVMYIAANQIMLKNSSAISSKGLAGTHGTSPVADGGGGAGGSAVILANSILLAPGVTSATLAVAADGAPGGANAGAQAAGGGLVSIQACQMGSSFNPTPVTLALSAAKGPDSGGGGFDAATAGVTSCQLGSAPATAVSGCTVNQVQFCH